jgi:hypothetical protein
LSKDIAIEPFTRELALEILPLGQKCWEEATIAKGEACAFYGQRDFAIEPDVDEYLKAAKTSVVVTLRDEGKLVGYVIGLLYRSLHHKSVQCALGDSIYVDPDYRSYTGVMVERFETEIKKLGAKIIGWPVTPDGPVYKVLKARGFVGDDVIMEKLCV